MLPRHLLARAQRTRITTARLARLQVPTPALPHANSLLQRNFHASSSRADELPKSPYRTFVDTLREEIRKNRELQDNVKQLQGDVEKIQDSEAMKRAREMYERARVCRFRVVLAIVALLSVFRSCLHLSRRIRNCARLPRSCESRASRCPTPWARLSRPWRKATSCVRYVASSCILRTITALQISKASAAVASSIEKTTEPIRKTEAYKALAETIIDALDDSGSAKHAGYEEKDARRARRQARLLKLGKQQGFAAGSVATVAVEENPECVPSHPRPRRISLTRA